jgi:hypothetical protein
MKQTGVMRAAEGTERAFGGVLHPEGFPGEERGKWASFEFPKKRNKMEKEKGRFT